MKIAVLTGPTASGKSALAIELAARLDGEIVNADSQQVYRGLDVGTAKPGAADRARVPHHLLEVASPGEGMDAARFQALADAALRDIASRSRFPLVVGGTGLYLRALLRGVAAAPGRDSALRAALAEEASREGRHALHARLKAVDPEAAARIHPNDLVRVVRALEIAAGGRTQTETFARHRFSERRYEALVFVLDLPRDELHARIETRAPRLFEGLLAETEALVARSGSLPARMPIGYADAALVLSGRLGREEALRRLIVAHRRYARRQLIWLRREEGFTFLEPPFDVDRLASRLAAFRTARGPG
ncbi:MAG TPA: tRNA (adenosine(37)-N6)-dimethylallyltransferase MiaA [Anaeromyxobacteraceae bacterium]|nr:tRNA (adenosine(37)-N6)-dimethylallyltransferase MiaA [Anaeromyxobacteraceae bacterium]